MEKQFLVKVEIASKRTPGKNGKYIVTDLNGNTITKDFPPTWLTKRAVDQNMAIERKSYKNNPHKYFWRRVSFTEYEKFATKESINTSGSENQNSTLNNLNTIRFMDNTGNANSIMEKASNKIFERLTNHSEFVSFIKESYKEKPEGLKLKEYKWKYLVRSIIRGRNVLITGPSGTGKTITAKVAAVALNRPLFVFNMGATQDAKTTLIGNTHLNKDTGTFFSRSKFVEAITTENSVILLDELSRASYDAWNILLPVLDPHQRELILDESSNHEIIKVADGVSFIATANIGMDYTSTRIMDRALTERFSILEMDVLNLEEEQELLKFLYPTMSDLQIKAIADIAYTTRLELNVYPDLMINRPLSNVSQLSTMISTRMSIEFLGLLYDGFSFVEAAEAAIYPFFTHDSTGSGTSERIYIKQILNKYVSDNMQTLDREEEELLSTDDLFTDKDIKQALKSRPKRTKP